MFVILKPEARKHIGTIEEIILQEGFDINSRHTIKDWISLASLLYRPQIDGDIVFAGEFNSYLWLTNHFFGNSAATLRLAKEGTLQENLSKISDLKPKIREKINGNDNNIRIFLNLDKAACGRKYHIGVVGCLGVKSEKGVELREKGRWDYFYFKYIHVPDPNIEDYERELRVLEDNGILDKEITSAKWEIMKKMQTLVYHEGGII
mgnify:CR=1 FL=1